MEKIIYLLETKELERLHGMYTGWKGEWACSMHGECNTMMPPSLSLYSAYIWRLGLCPIIISIVIVSTDFGLLSWLIIIINVHITVFDCKLVTSRLLLGICSVKFMETIKEADLISWGAYNWRNLKLLPHVLVNKHLDLVHLLSFNRLLVEGIASMIWRYRS